MILPTCSKSSVRPRPCDGWAKDQIWSLNLKRRSFFFIQGAAASDAQDLQAVVVADGDPVRLRGGPLHIVDLPLSSVGQDGILNGPWHLLDVPDQSLVVVS